MSSRGRRVSRRFNYYSTKRVVFYHMWLRPESRPPSAVLPRDATRRLATTSHGFGVFRNLPWDVAVILAVDVTVGLATSRAVDIALGNSVGLVVDITKVLGVGLAVRLAMDLVVAIAMGLDVDIAVGSTWGLLEMDTAVDITANISVGLATDVA